MIFINNNNKNRCCGCGACSSICPKIAISMETDEEGFVYPIVNKELCINCGACDRVCPFLKEYSSKKETNAIAAKSNDERIRSKSSSGGIFSLIAEYVLNERGVVYGSAMDIYYKKATHVRVENSVELERLRGSKYLQSLIGNSYKNVKKDLDSKKLVLFSGTPCQICGLKGYLGKEYSNLFTVEVICHGVPSDLLWRRYIDYLEHKYKANVAHVNFREKRSYQNKFGVYKNNDSVCMFNSVQTDPYLAMFLKNCCLRPSCYNCSFKEKESQADLTLGDFWGIQTIVPEFDDQKGISLVLLHSEKGRLLLKHIRDSLVFKDADYKLAIAHNKSYYRPTEKPLTRDKFYVDLKQKSFKKIISKYAGFSLKVKVKTIIKKNKFFAFFVRHRTNHNFSYGVKIIFKKR